VTVLDDIRSCVARAPDAIAVFPIGFIALLLARSELFTENFLVPVTARVAGHGSWPQLVRLWLVTLAANLAGGPCSSRYWRASSSPC
jgi:formate/nitrite transporter FocA (FNT family)